MPGMVPFKRSRKLTILQLSLCLALALGYVEASSAEQDSVGKVKQRRPKAMINGETEVEKDKSVFLKDSIQTLERAWVILALNKGSRGQSLRRVANIRIPDRTRIKIEDLGVRDSFLLELDLGGLLIMVPERLLGGYVRTPAARIQLGPSSIAEIEVHPNGDTCIIMRVGSATVEAGGQSRKVKAGEKTVVVPDKPALPPIPVAPDDSSILLLPTVQELQDSPILDHFDPRIFSRF